MIDTNTIYQNIIGFGGAFTDSAGEVASELPASLQRTLLAQYFGDNSLEKQNNFYTPAVSGANYTFMRVPLGPCDLSPSDYSYDDSEDDFELKNFSLHYTDRDYKVLSFNKNYGRLKWR